MNPKEFLEIAKLLSKNSSEAAIRSLISRSYYAVIIHIKEVMAKDLNIPLAKGDNIHELIPRYLKYSQVADTEDLATLISDFRERRNDADYNMAAKFNEFHKAWLGTAEEIIASFDKLNRKKLQAGILTYLRGLGHSLQ